MFITLEGIEGCGKTTQAKRLTEDLQKLGYKVFLTREPGGPEIAEKIREILLDDKNSAMVPETELLLYLASRAQHTAEWIIPKLQDGYLVICDRYTDSTLAYQGGGRGLEWKTLLELTDFASFSLIPDVTLLIDIPVELALHRIAHKIPDRLEKEDISFHKKVREMFLRVAKSSPKRYTIINGDNSVDKVYNEIKKTILLKIKDG